MNKAMIYFSAGCLGALANSMTVWLFGYFGITQIMGVAIAPELTPDWLYPRIVWGGIWGMLFLIPIYHSKLLIKGTVLSFVPTTIQLFVIFPYKAHKGFAGLELGLLTPVFVVFFNWIWGAVAAMAIKKHARP